MKPPTSALSHELEGIANFFKKVADRTHLFQEKVSVRTIVTEFLDDWSKLPDKHKKLFCSGQDVNIKLGRKFDPPQEEPTASEKDADKEPSLEDLRPKRRTAKQ